jgi:CheY-like chemotaxis protein
VILQAGAGRRPSGRRGARRDATHSDRAPRPRPAPQAKLLEGLTLLVVEDNPDIREYLRRLLIPLGADVVLAEHGQEALAFLEEVRPHVILLDLMMPVMDGFAMVQRMAREPKWMGIPVIAVTALGSGRDLMRTWEAGFAGHLTKPIEKADLIAAVQRILRGHAAPSARPRRRAGTPARPRRPRR